MPKLSELQARVLRAIAESEGVAMPERTIFQTGLLITHPNIPAIVMDAGLVRTPIDGALFELTDAGREALAAREAGQTSRE